MLIPAIKEDLAEIGVHHPYQLVHFLHLDNAGLRLYMANAILHTDDRPLLEFTSPISYYQKAENFLINLTDTLEYRPQDHYRFVTTMSPAEQGLFDRYGQHPRYGSSFLRTSIAIVVI